MTTTLTKFYPVKTTKDVVTLTVTIGDSQTGITAVSLDGVPLVPGHLDTLTLELGTGPDLKGKTLVCTTTISDVSAETNRTSVTYDLEGGVAPYSHSLEETVSENGGKMSYNASFWFFS
jgi:hypothetical protein